MEDGTTLTLVWIVLISLAPGKREAVEKGAVLVVDHVLVHVGTGQFGSLIAPVFLRENHKFIGQEVQTYLVHNVNEILTNAFQKRH
jgi:hypothetical protein